MKTKMIFSIAALLMLGNVCLNAQGNGEGATPTDYSKQPFTIVAHNEDVTIRMIASSSESFEDVQFSIDKGQTWSGPGNTDLFYKVIPANTTLSLRGYFLRYLSSLEISGGTFDVEGNIASLRADYEERNKWHTYTGAINLKGLFSGHTNLVSAENLILPATTLLESCYDSMFKGCTSLIKAPTLPATTLAKRCYQAMFEGCTSLTTAPELPATGVTWGCYGGMFRDCTSLTKAPEILPATNLMDGCNCYNGMFEGCTSLTTAPVLPANAVSCSEYVGMFEGCTKLNYVKCLLTSIDMPGDIYNWLKDVSPTGTFVKAASMNDWASGTSGIPSGWTVINDGATPIDYSKQPFTIVAIEAGTIQFSGTSSSTNDNSSIEYSIDSGSTWNTLYRNNSLSVSSGQKVYFRSSTLRPIGWGASGEGALGIGTFVTSKRFNVEGNAMSLLYGNDFHNKYDIGFSSAFAKLFYNNTKIVSAENLVLPATTLADYCYCEMFSGCTSLTTAPQLPATTLANDCYESMFADCTSLTTVPSNMLPATTLKNSCYKYMFQGCTSLTTAPQLPATEIHAFCYYMMFCGCTNLINAPSILPATTLYVYCYESMFADCTSLTTAPQLPATTLANHCYRYMFGNCTNLINVQQTLPATTLATYCYEDMFYRCTSLTTAPELPATTLAAGCYCDMFEFCSSLNYIKCLATDISALDCTSYWVYGVTSSGTFVKASSMNSWTRGASGIPSGWTVSNDGATPSTPTDYSAQYLTFVAIEDGTFSFSGSSSSTIDNSSIQYSLDSGSTWNTLNRGVQSPTVQAGQKIMWKSSTLRPTISSGAALGVGTFSSTGRFDVEGNVMSLLYGDNFQNQTDLTEFTYPTFAVLFKNNSNAINANNLVLPATTLVNGCYNSMFFGCTSLISLPKLPATTMKQTCYGQMFKGCTSLTTIPSNYLPATTLYTRCYHRMFEGCISLTTVPSDLLPATTLALACYEKMFYECTSLATAPVLPATTLAEMCYSMMFDYCSSLNYVKCLATDISASSCTQYWLSNVSSSGTFVKASSMNNWQSGVSGIPNGWTVTNAQAKQTKRTIHVATAGTLPNLISEDEKYQIEELTLTGELNGTDFKLIREMAGDIVSVKPKDIYRRVFHDSTDGKLKSLNISNAKIVKGGDYYNYIDSYYDVDGLSSKDNIISVGLFTDTHLESIILPNTVTSIEDRMNYRFFVYDGGNDDIEHSEGEYIGVFPTCLSSITISSSVISIGESVFQDCNALYSIIVENGNTNYDSRNNCNALIEKSTNSLIVGCKNTIIPNSVVSIGSSAFAWCSGLKSITIPNSVTSIGSSAFYNCSGLTSITIPNSVTSIGSYAFWGCSGLTSITIPNSVTSIGDGAFNGTAWYNNQPDGLLYAGKVAYSYKGEMPANTRISLLEGTLEIAGSAFFGCSGLTSVTIPNSVTSIGSSAFSGCSGLTSITIPNSVTSIGSYAFSGSSGLKSITIPNSVTSIGEWAFSHCGSLTSITIPNSVTSIGDGAFYNCSGLTKVVSKIKKPFTIDASVFPSDIYSNAELVVPAGTKSLYEAANGWKSFSKIIESPAEKRTIHVATAGTLPDLISEDEKYQIEELTLTGELNGTDIHFIRDMAGVNMDKMGTEYCPGINDEWAKTKGKLRVLDLSCVTIVEGGRDYYKMMTSSSKDLFDYYQYTKENSISTCMFADCWKLEQLILPRSVTSISDPLCDIYAAIPITINIKILKVADGNSYYDSRNNCNAIIETKTNTMIAGCLTTKIPESVTSIGDNAFLNLKNLSSVTIPNSVTSIGQSAFSGCSGLTSVTIPNSVTSIGEYAFSSCKGLTSITIPNNVTGIGDYAFIYCSGLTSVTISNSVTSIGSYAFSGCSSLTKVVSKIMEPFKIDSFTFPSDIYSNAELVVPAGTKSLYEATDGWNKFSKITEHLLTLETQPAQPTSTTKARLIALANEEDDDQHFGFEWLRYGAPESMQPNKVYAPLYNGQIVGTLSGLNPDIYYNYRPFYKSDSGEMVYGEWVTFLTGDANVFFEPEVHTKDAIVSYDGALLSAVFVEGTEDIQEKGFEYWPKNSNARAVSLTRGDNIGSVIVSGNNTSVTIEGLKAGTEYGYRPYVKTASGITYGEEKTFKTLMLGDVNGDNKVDNYDLSDLVSYIMGIIPPHFNKDAADLNNDKKVNAADIVKMVNILK